MQVFKVIFDDVLRFPFWCSIPIARRLLSPFCRTTSATIRRETHGSRGDDLHVGVVAGDSKHILETSKSLVIGVIFLAAVSSVWSQDLSRLHWCVTAVGSTPLPEKPTAVVFQKPMMWAQFLNLDWACVVITSKWQSDQTVFLGLLQSSFAWHFFHRFPRPRLATVVRDFQAGNEERGFGVDGLEPGVEWWESFHLLVAVTSSFQHGH